MKLVTAILALSWQPFGGPAVNGEKLANKPALRLSTTIIQERYCRDGGETLRIRLRLHYKNTAHHKVILYKGSRLVPHYFVSRTVRSASRNHYFEVGRNEVIFPTEQESLDSTSPGEPFAIIEPGKSFLSEAEVDIPVVDSSYPRSGFLRPDRYALRIVVATWLQSPELAPTLRRRWRRFGLLWYRPMTSAPMPFAVHKKRLSGQCE